MTHALDAGACASHCMTCPSRKSAQTRFQSRPPEQDLQLRLFGPQTGIGAGDTEPLLREDIDVIPGKKGTNGFIAGSSEAAQVAEI